MVPRQRPLNADGFCSTQLLGASFGAVLSVNINVYCDANAVIRTLAPKGPGVCLNYWNDGSSGFDNGGSGFLAALEAMNVGTLRYPGGGEV